MDKNAYVGGETAQVHVKVENDSAVDVTHFTSKLIREITLVAHGHTRTIRDIVCQAKYPGTPTMTKKESDIPLSLVGKKGHFIQASTNSRLVKCNYSMMIEMDIPWAPDLEIYSPVIIYAPQSPSWAQWRPPVWISQAQPQQVCAQLSVAPDIVASQMTLGLASISSPSISLSLGSPNTYNTGQAQVNLNYGTGVNLSTTTSPNMTFSIDPNFNGVLGSPSMSVTVDGRSNERTPLLQM